RGVVVDVETHVCQPAQIDTPLAVDAEAHARDRAAFEPDGARGYVEADPLSDRRHVAHPTAADRAINPDRDVVRAPIRAVLPGPVEPLEHDLARHVDGVDEYVSEQAIRTIDGHRLRSAVEDVLSESSGDPRLVGRAARVWRWIRGHPGPRLVTTGQRASWQA